MERLTWKSIFIKIFCYFTVDTAFNVICLDGWLHSFSPYALAQNQNCENPEKDDNNSKYSTDNNIQNFLKKTFRHNWMTQIDVKKIQVQRISPKIVSIERNVLSVDK